MYSFFCESCDKDVFVGRATKVTTRNEYLRVTVVRKSICPHCKSRLVKDGDEDEKSKRRPIGSCNRKPTKSLVIGENQYFIHGRPKNHLISPASVKAALEREKECREARAREEKDGTETNSKSEAAVSTRDNGVSEG